ncbi:hypothetical protein CBR_g54301 [Chara braunii]|uniref:Uncharacterized protein n=1 Tax=Chara braunii TaxID=69332 RepID=A0A388MBV4_CHABU|nr:hypothetical protein CBR_g54301 [Chara braunii]|eukprot:GBG92047.1 hypothetical protein CBR_g54301 [Chara braunii]
MSLGAIPSRDQLQKSQVWDWFQTPASGQDSEPVKVAKDRTQRRSTTSEVPRKPRSVLSSAPKSLEAAKSGRDVSPLSSGLGLLLAEKKSGGVVGSLMQAEPGDSGRKVLVLHNTVGVTSNILDAVKSASSSLVPSASRPAWAASHAAGESRMHGPVENILMPVRLNADLVVEPQPSSVKSFDRFSMTDSGTNTPVSRSSVISIESSFTMESSTSSTAQLVKEEELLDPTSLRKEGFTSVKEVEEHESRSLPKGAAIEWRGKCLNESFSSVKDVEDHESHGSLWKGAATEWSGDYLVASETLDRAGCRRTPSEDGTGVEQERTSDDGAGIEEQGQGTSCEGSNTLSELGSRDDMFLGELDNGWTPTPSAPDEGPGDDCSLDRMTVPQAVDPQTALNHGSVGGSGGTEGTNQLREGPADSNIAGGNYSVCALGDVSEDGDARCAGHPCADGDGGYRREVASVVEEDGGKSIVNVGDSCGESSTSYTVGCGFPDRGRCTSGPCMDGGDKSLGERVGVVEDDEGKGTWKDGEICAERSSHDMMMVTEEDVCGLDVAGCPDDGRSQDDQCMEGSKGDDDAKVDGFCACTAASSAAVCGERAIFNALGITALQEEDSSRGIDDLCMEGAEDGGKLGMCDYSVNQTGMKGRGETSDLVLEHGIGGHPRCKGGKSLDHLDGLMIADDDFQCQVAGKTGLEDRIGKREDGVVDDDVQGVLQLIRRGSAIKSTVGDPSEAVDERLCMDTGDDGMKEVDCSLKNMLRLEALMDVVEETDDGTEGGVKGAEKEGVVYQGQVLGSSEKTSVESASIELGHRSNLPERAEQALPEKLSAVERSMAGADGEQPTDVPCLESDWEGGHRSECDSPSGALPNFQECTTIGGLQDLVVEENATRTVSTPCPSPVTISSICSPRSFDAISLVGDPSQVAGGESLPVFSLPCDGCQVVENPAELAGREPHSMPNCGDTIRRLDFHASGGEVEGQGHHARSLEPANFSRKKDVLPLAGSSPIQSAPLFGSSCLSLIECNDASLTESRVVVEESVTGAGNRRPTLAREASSGLLLASHPSVAQPRYSVPLSLSAMSSRSAALLEGSVPVVSLTQMTSQTLIPVPVADSNEVWSNLPIDEDDNRPQSCVATAQLLESAQSSLPYWSSIATAQPGQSQLSIPHWSSTPCSGQTETAATGTVSAVENLGYRERLGVPPAVACFGVSGEPETDNFFPRGTLVAEAEAGFERHGDDCGNPVEKPCVSYPQVMDPERNTRPGACCTRRTAWEREVYVAMCREYTENLFRQLVSRHLQEYSASVSGATLLRNYSNGEGSSRGDKAGSLAANRSAAAQMASAHACQQMEFPATEPEAVQKQGIVLGPPGVSVGRGLLLGQLCQALPRNEPMLELMATQSAGREGNDLLPDVAKIQAVAWESGSASTSAFQRADGTDELRPVNRDGGGGGQVSPNRSTQGKDQEALGDLGLLQQIGTGAGQHLVLDVGSSSTRAGDIEECVMSANKGLLRRLQHPDVGKRMIVKNLGVLMVMLVTVVLYTRMICKGAVAWAKEHPSRRNVQQCKEQPRPEESV